MSKLALVILICAGIPVITIAYIIYFFDNKRQLEEEKKCEYNDSTICKHDCTLCVLSDKGYQH